MIYERGVAGSRARGTPIPSLVSTFQPYRRIHRNARAEKQRRLIDTWETCNKKKLLYSEYVSLVIPSAIVYKLKIPYAFFSAF